MSQQQGHTRWKRFGLVMVPTLAATAAVGVALSQSALAASFSVSGQSFKVAVDKLDGKGFTQYGTIDKDQGGHSHPVAVSAFSSAKLTNLCQSVVLPIPVFGDVSLNIGAGTGGKPASASNMYIDLTHLKGDATFTNMDIGTAVEGLNKGPKAKKGDTVLPGSFSQQSDRAIINDVRQSGRAITAGTFKLTNLDLQVKKGKHECY